MLDATKSGCLNHPTVEAVGRCKQCSTPFCGACEVRSPHGRFCSDVCKDKFAQFTARAQELDKHAPRAGLFTRLRLFAMKAFALVLAIGAIAFALVYFNVPVAGPVARRLFQVIGVQLPF